MPGTCDFSPLFDLFQVVCADAVAIPPCAIESNERRNQPARTAALPGSTNPSKETEMGFPELVKAALELGVVPALALFLVVAMFLQNKQLMNDRRAMEKELLAALQSVVSNYQKVVEASQQQSRAKK
jgi:hypothetical protein